MAKPVFAMSMYASKADLYQAKADYYEAELKKLRGYLVAEKELAENPAPYQNEEDYSHEFGKAMAYGDVLDEVNKIIG